VPVDVVAVAVAAMTMMMMGLASALCTPLKIGQFPDNICEETRINKTFNAFFRCASLGKSTQNVVLL